MTRPVHVLAGALVDPAGRVLIAERPAGKSQAGRWEFPGGKRDPGESPREALARELAEELGIELGAAEPLLAVTHHYPGAPSPVLIDCWRVDSWRGIPEPRDGQRLRWCTLAELVAADILEADRALVTALIVPRLLVRLAPGAAAAAQARAAARGGRVGWLIDAPLAEAPEFAGLGVVPDALFLIDPPGPPGAGRGAIYTGRGTLVRATERLAPAGQLVADAHGAREALDAGADFLLVAGRETGAAGLAAIAAVGLPWYLNVTRAGAAGEPTPTGRLWWRPAATGG